MIDRHLAQGLSSLFAVVLVLLVSACSGKKEQRDTKEPVGAQNCRPASEIFADNGCFDCHDRSPGIAGADLDLLSDGVGKRLVGQPSQKDTCEGLPLVDPMNPSESLLLKLIDPEKHASWKNACVAPMPLGEEAMPKKDRACLATWVADIAKSEKAPASVEIAFSKASPESVLAKTKYLLHGGVVLKDELTQVTNTDKSLNSEGLRKLVRSYMKSSEFSDKFRDFLALSLQQIEISTGRSYRKQLRTRGAKKSGPVDNLQLFAGLESSFVDTAWDLVDSRGDFRKVVTTRRWKVTTAILVTLSFLDKPRKRAVRFDEFAHLTEADYQDWRYIHFDQAKRAKDTIAWSNSVEFAEAMRAIPADGHLALMAPRVGFFNTPTFFSSWQTNQDNQFRVTTNQTLIAALDATFEAGDLTEQSSVAGLPFEHAPKKSACFACHRLLDPMRIQFAKYYGFNNVALPKAKATIVPSFAFHGETNAPKNMDDFASSLAHHKRFAPGWIQKLCMWGNSQRCKESDPVFKKISNGFAKNHDLLWALEELMVSPLITASAKSVSHTSNGFFVSVSRSNHLCHALDTRLNALEAAECKTKGGECASVKEVSRCSRGRQAKDMAKLLSRDTYNRGARDFVQESLGSPFSARALGELCTSIGRQELRKGRALGSKKPDDVFRNIVEGVMGLPSNHSRYASALSSLQEMYAFATATPACTEEQHLALDRGESPACGLALKKGKAKHLPWLLACTSPEIAGFGL